MKQVQGITDAPDFGSGIFGQWVQDENGLPAYCYTMRYDDPRCPWNPSPLPPSVMHWHQLGNDRLNANAYNLGMVKVFKEAKRQALSRGTAPPETRQGIEMFQQSGVLGKARERARTKLGLGQIAAPGGDELARLLKDTFSRKDE